MEKKKVFKMVGIVILSLVGLGILSFFSMLLLKSVYNKYAGSSNIVNESYMQAGGVMLDSYDSRSSALPPTVPSPTNSGYAPDVVDKSIIKQGQIELRADDIDRVVENVNTVMKKYDAEISNSNDSGSGKSRNVNLVIRVKEDSFEAMFKDLELVGDEKLYSSSVADDVTEQVMDLQARLVTYKNTEAQLLEIQKKATTVTDTMAVYKELTEIRYKIESTESQIKYYATQTKYSTISVTISQSSSGSFVSEEKWRPFGVLKNAIRALGEFGKGLVNLAIWFVFFVVPIGLIVWLIVYVVRKARK